MAVAMASAQAVHFATEAAVEYSNVSGDWSIS